MIIHVHVQGCSEAALDTPDGFLLPLGDYTVHVGKLRHYKNLIPWLSTLACVTELIQPCLIMFCKVEIKDAKMSSFSSDFQTLIKH